MYLNENLLERIFRQRLVRHVIEAISEHALAICGIDPVKSCFIAANERFDLARLEWCESFVFIES